MKSFETPAAADVYNDNKCFVLCIKLLIKILENRLLLSLNEIFCIVFIHCRFLQRKVGREATGDLRVFEIVSSFIRLWNLMWNCRIMAQNSCNLLFVLQALATWMRLKCWRMGHCWSHSGRSLPLMLWDY